MISVQMGINRMWLWFECQRKARQEWLAIVKADPIKYGVRDEEDEVIKECKQKIKDRRLELHAQCLLDTVDS